MPARSTARTLGTLLIALLAVAACTNSTAGTARPAPTTSTAAVTSASPSPTPTPAQVAEANFADCSKLFNLAGIPSSRRGRLTVGCARLAVPLDYTHPTGTKIAIQLVKIHYTRQTNRVGSLLVDPGGPGASGVVLAINLAGSISTDILEHFDLVGFDPRGVNLSAPLTCYSDAQKDYNLSINPDVRTTAGFSQAKKAWAAVATACHAKYGTALAQYNTVATARDMDAIRAAVGDAKLNYLGFSYGTELGAVYAHLFPKNVRAAVLDGAVDPANNNAPITAAGEQIKGFEDAFDQFAADCATRSGCRDLGDARAAVTALAKQADTRPIPVAGTTRKVTGGLVLLAALAAMYNKAEWPGLGSALLEAQQGDGHDLLALADSYGNRDAQGKYGNLLDVFTVVSCNDEARETDPTDAQIRATAELWATQYPLFGLTQAASLFTCQSWPTIRTPLPPETAVGSAPILVLGNLHDPATPYVGAVHLAKTLTTGVLLSWNGEGHTSYGQSTCIDTKVNAYLISGTVPAANITCPR